MASQSTHLQDLGLEPGFVGKRVARNGSEDSGVALMPVERPFEGERFFNRDLSWLAFNRRVLDLASDDLPLLERVRLFAIVGSNLDEFFAVRMAALERM